MRSRSAAAASAETDLNHADILTPSWRVREHARAVPPSQPAPATKGEDEEVVFVPSEGEAEVVAIPTDLEDGGGDTDSSDEAYVRRHEPLAIEERRRWSGATPDSGANKTDKTSPSDSANVTAGNNPSASYDGAAARDGGPPPGGAASPRLPGSGAGGAANGAASSMKRTRSSGHSKPCLPLYPTPLECWEVVQTAVKRHREEAGAALRDRRVLRRRRRALATVDTPLHAFAVVENALTRERTKLRRALNKRKGIPVAGRGKSGVKTPVSSPALHHHASTSAPAIAAAAAAAAAAATPSTPDAGIETPAPMRMDTASAASPAASPVASSAASPTASPAASPAASYAASPVGQPAQLSAQPSRPHQISAIAIPARNGGTAQLSSPGDATNALPHTPGRADASLSLDTRRVSMQQRKAQQLQRDQRLLQQQVERQQRQQRQQLEQQQLQDKELKQHQALANVAGISAHVTEAGSRQCMEEESRLQEQIVMAHINREKEVGDKQESPVCEDRNVYLQCLQAKKGEAGGADGSTVRGQGTQNPLLRIEGTPPPASVEGVDPAGTVTTIGNGRPVVAPAVSAPAAPLLAIEEAPVVVSRYPLSGSPSPIPSPAPSPPPDGVHQLPMPSAYRMASAPAVAAAAAAGLPPPGLPPQVARSVPPASSLPNATPLTGTIEGVSSGAVGALAGPATPFLSATGCAMKDPATGTGVGLKNDPGVPGNPLEGRPPVLATPERVSKAKPDAGVHCGPGGTGLDQAPAVPSPAVPVSKMDVDTGSIPERLSPTPQSMQAPETPLAAAQDSHAVSTLQPSPPPQESMSKSTMLLEQAYADFEDVEQFFRSRARRFLYQLRSLASQAECPTTRPFNFCNIEKDFVRLRKEEAAAEVAQQHDRKESVGVYIQRSIDAATYPALSRSLVLRPGYRLHGGPLGPGEEHEVEPMEEEKDNGHVPQSPRTPGVGSAHQQHPDSDDAGDLNSLDGFDLNFGPVERQKPKRPRNSPLIGSSRGVTGIVRNTGRPPSAAAVAASIAAVAATTPTSKHAPSGGLCQEKNVNASLPLLKHQRLPRKQKEQKESEQLEPSLQEQGLQQHQHQDHQQDILQPQQCQSRGVPQQQQMEVREPKQQQGQQFQHVEGMPYADGPNLKGPRTRQGGTPEQQAFALGVGIPLPLPSDKEEADRTAAQLIMAASPSASASVLAAAASPVQPIVGQGDSPAYTATGTGAQGRPSGAGEHRPLVHTGTATGAHVLPHDKIASSCAVANTTAPSRCTKPGADGIHSDTHATGVHEQHPIQPCVSWSASQSQEINTRGGKVSANGDSPVKGTGSLTGTKSLVLTHAGAVPAQSLRAAHYALSASRLPGQTSQSPGRSSVGQSPASDANGGDHALERGCHVAPGFATGGDAPDPPKGSIESSVVKLGTDEQLEFSQEVDTIPGSAGMPVQTTSGDVTSKDDDGDVTMGAKEVDGRGDSARPETNGGPTSG